MHYLVFNRKPLVVRGFFVPYFWGMLNKLFVTADAYGLMVGKAQNKNVTII